MAKSLDPHMTVKQLIKYLEKLIKNGTIKRGAKVETHEGMEVWESNIDVVDDGKTVVL